MTDKQIARHFLHYSECLSKPLPFFKTQIGKPFLNFMISAKHDKGLRFLPIGVSVYSSMFF